MRTLMLAVATLAFTAAPALAAPCKDPKTGRFAKCVEVHQVKRTVTKTTVTGGKCRNDKGQYTKCGTPGSHPVG